MILVFLGILHLFIVASPGTDFYCVGRAALLSSSRKGLACALGVGAAHLSLIFFFSALWYTAIGLVPALTSPLASGRWILLSYFGLLFSWQWWRDRKHTRQTLAQAPFSTAPSDFFSARKSPFLDGFSTIFRNRNAIAYFLFVIAPFVVIETNLTHGALFGLGIALESFAWFSLVAVVLGSAPVRKDPVVASLIQNRYYAGSFPVPLAMLYAIQVSLDSFERLDEIRAEAALGELVSQVAHDLGSPVAALKIVSREIADLPSAQRHLLEAAIQRIQSITEDLAQRRSMVLPSAYLRQKISREGLVEITTAILQEKRTEYSDKPGVKFNLETASLPASVWANESALSRILSNLVNNAVEALGKSGTVTLGLESTAEGVLLRVRDTGKGIPAEVLPMLGRKGVSIQKGRGLGLGLYSARRHAESWGGYLRIDSEVGRGTCITLHLLGTEN